MADAFPSQNCVIQGDNLLAFLLNFSLKYAIGKVKENQQGTGTEWNTAPGLCL
jgi:hypothetical protein